MIMHVSTKTKGGHLTETQNGVIPDAAKRRSGIQSVY
jgi:hypothetical protein